MSTPNPESDPVPDPPLPREIGGYRIQRILGTGGMATVYAAMQERPRRTVALKVLKAGNRSDLALRRFRREVEILGKLRHPFIAQVYEAGTHDEPDGGTTPYLVMEYVPRARTILEHVAAEDLDLRARLKLFAKVCAAVEHGHRRKVIHRDLKPGNILIDESGQPKVIDFGVARATELDGDHQTLDTESGRIVGTIQYMSPEQLDTTPRDLDARCDVYALGVILYKLLTTQMPHDLTGLPIHVAARKICDDEPRSPSALKPELRGDLERIILKALAKDRFQRYRDAGSLGRDVLRFLGDRPVNAGPASSLHRTRLLVRRQRTLLIAILAGVVVLGGAGAAIAWMARSRGLAAERHAQEMQRERDQRAEIENAVAALRDRAAGVGRENERRDAFVLDGRDSAVRSLVFDAGGAGLVSGAADHSAALWNLAERSVIMSLREHDAPVTALGLSIDGRRVVLGAEDGGAVLLETATGRIVRRYRGTGAALTSLAMTRAGDRLALGRDDLTLHLLDDEGRTIRVLRSASGALRAAAFSGDGSSLAAGSDGGVVYVWDTASGALAGAFRGVDAPIAAVCFVADTGRIAALHENGRGVLWTESGRGVNEFRVTAAPVTAVAFDPEGRFIAVAGPDEVEVRSLDAPMTIVWRTRTEQPVSVLALDAGAWWCAAGHDEGRIDVWPVERSQPEGTE